MVDEDSKPESVWASPRFSWALVILGMSLVMLLRAPSFAGQVALCSEQMTSRNVTVLGYLALIATIPILGLWRLSARLGLPRILSFLYLVFPIATIGIYLVWPFLSRFRPNR